MTTEASSSDAITERTEVLHGEQNVVNTVLQFTSKAKSRIDACVDYTRPLLAVEIEQLRKAFLDAKRRGVKLRYITEITEDNVGYCKELIKIVDDLRHLEGIKGNFYLSETEYIAPATFHEKGKPASWIIYSNVKEIVEYQRHFVFDSFLSRSIPAEQKIKEIEEGIIHYETRIVEDPDQIIEEISRLTANSNELSTCLTPGGMQYSYNYFFKIKKKLLEKQKKGQHKGIRYISRIEKDNIDLTKTYLNYGIQIRHVKNLPPMSFGVSDKEMLATIEKMEGGKKIQSLLISNEPLYIKHFNSLFEELWKNGIDATETIREIEEKVQVEFVDVIADHEKASSILLDLAKSLKKEALSLMPTARGMLRMYKLGVIDHLIKASQNGAIVKIICPLNEENSHIVEKISEQAPDIRIMNMYTDAPSGILIADSERFLQAEVKNPMAEQFSEAIGFIIYSNSKHNVNSFKSFFELLWNQHALNEELRRIDEVQKEFINTAAHELRTPVQPILGLSEVVLSNTKDIEQAKLLQVVSRNAKRLQRLTEDILDVTKIESHSLILRKEQFNLNDVITNAIDDIMTNKVSLKTESNNNNDAIKLQYKSQNVFVYGDKGRISQVILNLLHNAVKFTNNKEGTITVVVEKKEDDDEQHNNNQQIIISIKDSGKGIDPQIFPRLFTKFATRSETGTGLGLFICKGIIEAHGGKIRAENNSDSIGATFAFSLPIVNK
jgi:two-component system, OmpR family, sensor histidine kinase VicK